MTLKDRFLGHITAQELCIADRCTFTERKIVLVGNPVEGFQIWLQSKFRWLMHWFPVHRVPPHGGHSMNQDVEEAVAIGFGLSAVVKGYGGPLIIMLYEFEHRTITGMIRTLERSVHHVRSMVYEISGNPQYQLLERWYARWWSPTQGTGWLLQHVNSKRIGLYLWGKCRLVLFDLFKKFRISAASSLSQREKWTLNWSPKQLKLFQNSKATPKSCASELILNLR